MDDLVSDGWLLKRTFVVLIDVFLILRENTYWTEGRGSLDEKKEHESNDDDDVDLAILAFLAGYNIIPEESHH